jgi:hypothetical protein
MYDIKESDDNGANKLKASLSHYVVHAFFVTIVLLMITVNVKLSYINITNYLHNPSNFSIILLFELLF